MTFSLLLQTLNKRVRTTIKRRTFSLDDSFKGWRAPTLAILSLRWYHGATRWVLDIKRGLDDREGVGVH